MSCPLAVQTRLRTVVHKTTCRSATSWLSLPHISIPSRSPHPLGPLAVPLCIVGLKRGTVCVFCCCPPTPPLDPPLWSEVPRDKSSHCDRLAPVLPFVPLASHPLASQFGAKPDHRSAIGCLMSSPSPLSCLCLFRTQGGGTVDGTRNC